MKTLQKITGIVVLLSAVSVCAYAQGVAKKSAESVRVIDQMGHVAGDAVSAKIAGAMRAINSEVQRAAAQNSFREVFPEIGVGIRDNEELTVTPLNFLRSGAHDKAVKGMPLIQMQAAARGNVSPAQLRETKPVFVPFDNAQKVSYVGVKEYFSATPEESPAWVGTYGLKQCVGLVIVSKQGTRVLRTSVAYINGKTEIALGQSKQFFAQAIDKHATTLEVYFLADNRTSRLEAHADNYSDPERVSAWNSPNQIVKQIKDHLVSFSNHDIHYYEQLNGVSQFAVNTATGRVSTEVSYPRDFNWTDQDELHFNQSISSLLHPAELSPSPIMQDIIQRRSPNSHPVRESFPELGVEIMNDADGTIRPIGQTELPRFSEAKQTHVSGPATSGVREKLSGVQIVDDADLSIQPTHE